MSIRQLARRFNHSRRKVRRVLAESEQAPRKQQHTAARLYRRLRDKRSYAGRMDRPAAALTVHLKRLRLATMLAEYEKLTQEASPRLRRWHQPSSSRSVSSIR
jgi:transcription initiation factor TFIIIB Brf1 subunit/transcription initiation factor TFIIB